MKTVVCLILAAVFSSCGSPTRVSKPLGDRYVITLEEIEQSKATNAFELIRERRPEFLRAQGPKTMMRGARSTTMPTVYLNEMLLGETRELVKIPIETIKEVRYLNEVDAQQKYGLGNVAGAILITTKF